MFGLKRKVQQHAMDYLDTIRAWAIGQDFRGWVAEDFYTVQASATPGVNQRVPIESVKEYRTDPSHVIFPLLPYNITLLDRLFMSRRLLQSMLHLNQAISSFNATLAMFMSAQAVEQKWEAAVMLHVGLIGTVGTGGLHDKYLAAVKAVSA